jgi:hypothetical protein
MGTKVTGLGYRALLWFDSLIMVPCVSKHVEISSVLLLCEYLRKNYVHSVILLL